MGASLVLRTGALGTGYWIDEGIAVGIASHDLADIPRVLGQDGNPPLYYLLLHGWMELFGTGEAATRALSLVFALLAVPASFWAGSRGLRPARGRPGRGRRRGQPVPDVLRAGDADVLARRPALDPGLGELRAGVRARGAAARRVARACGSALLLYTHTWGLFLAAAMGARVAGAVAARAGGRARRGAAGRGAGAALRAVAAERGLPGRAHRRAVGGAAVAAAAARRSRAGCSATVALPLLALAVFFALRRRPPVDRAVRVLAAIAVTTVSLAWLCSQIEPAWATRYLAVVLGPLLLALASVVSRGARWTALALVGVAVVWLMSGPPPVKSNVRTVSTGDRAVDPPRRPRRLDPARAGAGAVSLPAGGRRLPDADGARARPAPDRLARRARAAARRAGGDASCCPRSARLDRGRRVLIVTPGAGRAALAGAVGARRADPHARVARGAGGVAAAAARSAASRRSPLRKNTVRAELYEVR